MRQIVLDTETTGLDPAQGHRVIEIGCVELVSRRVTGATFHRYLQPDRDIDAEAEAVHGLSAQFLASQPRFDEIAEEFVDFISGAELIIHNAAFDVGFINHELRLWRPDHPPVAEICTVLDTLTLARNRHPGQRNSLDALCNRYGVDNSDRTLHGALLDSRILADVYLAMTGGQVALLLDEQESAEDNVATRERESIQRVASNRPPLTVIRASDAEIAAHEAYLDGLDKASGGACAWRRLDAAS